MSLTKRTGASGLWRRTAVAAAALAVTGGAIAAGVTTAQARVVPPNGGTTAREAPPKFVATPEKITHPNRDYMGSTVAAHFHGKLITAKAAEANTVPQLPGIDVSSYQGNINWSSVCPYIDFAYAKATEGTDYINPDFTNQYNGPYNCKGVVRGAYHFALPSTSTKETGTIQAEYFVAHGGGWSGDGKTLPGTLDIEYNPYGPECYGLNQTQMLHWIWNFVNEYRHLEHNRAPVIYTTYDWWKTCEGNQGIFSTVAPLWIANYSASHGGPLPPKWGTYTFWQYRDSGSLPGDQDVFNGDKTRLEVLAKNG